MKFICDRNALLSELTVAQEIVSSRNALSILSNVHLKASEGTLTIRATDLKIHYETSLPINTIEEGETTLLCERLNAILKSIPEGDIMLERVSEERYLLHPADSTRIRFELRAIPSGKYPEFPVFVDNVSFQMKSSTFSRMTAHTSFAVSDDESRHFMNGVFIECQDTNMVFVATDGRRLSIEREFENNQIPEFSGIIVPPKILNLTRKIAGEQGSIDIQISEKMFRVTIGGTSITSSLVDGQFPNYERVIPQTQAHSFTVSTVDLSDALRRVALLIDKSRRVYVDIRPNQLSLSSDEGDMGQAQEQIDCDYQGDELRIALNLRYLTDPLRVIEDERVRFDFTDPTRAVTIRPVSTETEMHIVMPMQLE
jgi:DNA polymerase III subunit beta